MLGKTVFGVMSETRSFCLVSRRCFPAWNVHQQVPERRTLITFAATVSSEFVLKQDLFQIFRVSEEVFPLQK